jgi:hypothetical protein
MATDLEIQFNLKAEELLALRERKNSGEKLTAQQYSELGLYRDLLNAYVQNKRKEDRLITINAAKEAVAAARDIQAAETKRLQIEFAEKAALFTALTSGKGPLVPTETVEQKAPAKPVLVETPINPTNVNQSIRDIQNTGKGVEEATKTQEFSKQEGIFNEFSSSVAFIETIKTTVAQSSEKTLIAVSAPVPVVVNQDAGAILSSIETLKTDVSQILQTGEVQIQRTVQLSTINSAVYSDPESAVRAIPVKQDSLDPAVQLIQTENNPYNITGSQLDILQNQLAVESINLITQAEVAAQIQEFEQTQLYEEQAAAVETFTGGG